MRTARERIIAVAIIILVAFAVTSFFRTSYNGPDVIEDPVQIMLASPEQFEHQGDRGPVTIEKLAAYTISAAVKSRYRYSTDYVSQIAPLDFVLAWGSLNAKETDTQIRYRQSNRWYYFQFKSESPVSETYIYQHSANTHLIPADDSVRRELNRIRENEYITLDGFLVNVLLESQPWRSSLTRSDTGNGACEILYVTRVVIH